MGLPLVGIVVLNYNGWQMTLACLASLDHLNYPAGRVRIVVVDNASTDDSVDQIVRARPNVELVVNAANLGFAQGNNVAIRALMDLGCEYIWLINNDATADPEALSEMVACAEARPRIGQVGSVVYHAHAPERVQAWGGGPVSLWTGHTRLAVTPNANVDYITGASMLIRSKALAEVGPLDGRFFFQWEDVELGFRMRARGWMVCVSPAAKVWHKGGGADPGLSTFRVYHHACGVVLLLRTYAPLPWLSTLPVLGYYALVSVRQRSMAPLIAGLRGWLKGWTL